MGMQTMNRMERFWDKQANEYDKNESKFEQTYHKTVANTKQYLKNNDIVLDYACGTGITTNEIAGYVKEIHAIDISAKMIEVAKRKAGERNIENINYEQATIFDERFKNESFNVILAFNILHLLEDTQEVLRRINELLKPGGLFISATACLGEKKSFFSILISLLSKIGIVPYTRNLTFSELKDLVTNGDFKIIETENISHSPPNYFIVAKKL
jgi:2-polyprenyl-3-methyl-5-hydroxy-6-metoxy-1,4-benzoquinol methylase